MLRSKKQDKALKIVDGKLYELRNKLEKMTESQLTRFGVFLLTDYERYQRLMSKAEYKIFMRGFRVNRNKIFKWGLCVQVNKVAKDKTIEIYIKSARKNYALANAWADEILDSTSALDLR